MVDLMQLAYGNANGILASIGYTNWSSWISQNIDVFQQGGPLKSFWSVSSGVLQHCFKEAEQAAWSLYESHHSSEQGREHDDIPHWANIFFAILKKSIISRHSIKEQWMSEMREIRWLLVLLNGKQILVLSVMMTLSGFEMKCHIIMGDQNLAGKSLEMLIWKGSICRKV